MHFAPLMAPSSITMIKNVHRDAKLSSMRTTVTLADDVAAGIEKLRRERGLGLSEAINDLVRAGLMDRSAKPRIECPAHDMGIGIDVRNVAEAIETIELHDGLVPP
jgi:metal-responsive CopG/Arc/MetJ family transcriptional regulator